MRHKHSLKYILDIESLIDEIERILVRYSDFESFNDDFIVKRAIERQLEIIGEAMGKMLKIDPDLKISNSKKIVSLRNLIAHAYDSVDSAVLWGIIKKDIPILKEEITKLKNKF